VGRSLRISHKQVRLCSPGASAESESVQLRARRAILLDQKNGREARESRGANSENDTNEAKFDESVIVIQNERCVGVTANSGVVSGLDRGPEVLGVSRGKSGVDRGYSFVVAEGG